MYVCISKRNYSNLKQNVYNDNTIYMYGSRISMIALRGITYSGSGVELRTLDYENPGLSPGCGVKTLGKFFHVTLLQFTRLYK